MIYSTISHQPANENPTASKKVNTPSVYVPTGMFHHNKAMPYAIATGVGLGIAALGVGAYTVANVSHSSGRLQKWIQNDLKTIAKHMKMQEQGKALQIQYRDLPDSFKSLRTLKLNFNRKILEDVEVTIKGKKLIEKRVNVKELFGALSEWLPFLGTLFNGFPLRNRLQVIGYALSPTFWMKDLFSKDGMWLKKLLSIAGTPAKKITQQLAEKTKGLRDMKQVEKDIENLEKKSTEAFKKAFAWNKKDKRSRGLLIMEGIASKFLSKILKPFYTAMNDLQDNAPPLPLNVIVKQMTPYFKKTYPNLDMRLSKFKIINVASVGHIVTHQDLPNSAFKVIRPIEDDNLLATGRAIYGVLVTAGPELVQLAFENIPLKEPERLKRLVETKEFSTLSYQFCLQFLSGLKKESLIQREFDACKAFRTHYHGHHGLIVPDVFGCDVNNGIIEMEFIKDSLSMTDLEARSIDKTKSQHSQDFNRIKAQAFYAMIQRGLDFSESHISHTDIHGGQFRYQEGSKKIALLDFGAYLRFSPDSRKRIVDTLLTAHLNKAYYLKGQNPPRNRSVIQTASKLGTGLNEIQNNHRLTEIFSQLDSPLTFSAVGLMNGLSGDGVNNWSVAYDLKKLDTFGKGVKNLDETAMNALNSQQRKALPFMSIQTFESDIDRLVASMLKQSSLTFNADEQAKIRYSLRNEFLTIFKPYIRGAETLDVATFEVHHMSLRKAWMKAHSS
ncbi:MAG: AarF/UbiB family protein [Vampirovibrionales bacterium]